MSEEPSAVVESAVAVTRRWLEQVVIGLNLCPFAVREVRGGRVRFAVLDATTADEVLAGLEREMDRLLADERIETTLVIHPHALQRFAEYNRFLDAVDGLLVARNLEGVLQVASFHPDYRFAGTRPDDPENYSNRSPYPMLHLLREQSVTRAVAAHPDVEGIPAANIERLNALGTARLRRLLRDCGEYGGPVTGESAEDN